MLHDFTAWLVAAVLLLLGAIVFGIIASQSPATEITVDSNISEPIEPVELVIVSYGGSYQDAQRKAFFEPFERQYGVEIRDISYSGDLAEIEAMMASGNVHWDIIAIESSLLHHGAREGLFERINSGIVSTQNLLPEAIHDNGIAICFWSNILAYNSDQYSTASAPRSWADFWDIDQFPGFRALHDTPISTLEIALMADGVSPETIYPLDVDRAFASLDRIKHVVSDWWVSGETPANLLASAEVSMASAWNGRIYNHRTAGGEPVQEIWQGGLIDADYWVVPVGSDNVDLAMEFINFASEEAQQAAFPTYIPYGPINRGAIDSLPTSVAINVPTSSQNAGHQVFIDSLWWDENYDRVKARWDAWKFQ